MKNGRLAARPIEPVVEAVVVALGMMPRAQLPILMPVEVAETDPADVDVEDMAVAEVVVVDVDPAFGVLPNLGKMAVARL